MKRFIPLLALLAGGCETTGHGLDTPHQPVVTGSTATVPGCPDWDNGIGGERERQSSNFGCATMSNLTAMVVDAQDLLHGRSGDGSGAGETAQKAVDSWRRHIPTGTRWNAGGRNGGNGGGGGGGGNNGGNGGGGDAGGGAAPQGAQQ